MDIIQEAKKIATADLRSCYREKGVYASSVNFSDYWARDTFWASWGMLEIGDDKIVKKSLDLFLNNQRQDGDVPRKISLDWNVIKYIFKKSIPRSVPRPIYKGNIPLANSKDENSLLIIAFEKYLQKTRDTNFAQEKYDALKLSMKWYEKKMKNGFIREYLLSNWMDTIFKNGNVLYTNALYCQALKSFSEIASYVGKKEDSEYYQKKYIEFKDKINSEFWNGEFYDDELGKYRMFDLAGNVLAVVLDIADQEKAKKIIKKADEIKSFKKNARLHPINYPHHPFWKIAPMATAIGIINYQNEISWSWIEALLVAAKVKAGEKDKAIENLKDFSCLIAEKGHIHETYFPNGRPFDHLLWKSAVPFAWGAGLFLWACSYLEKAE